MGVIGIAAGQDEDQVMEVALEGGAEDVVSGEDGSIEVLTSPENFPEVSEALRSAGLEPEYAEVTMRASTSAGLGLDDARTMVKLLEMLEELDDVQQVYSNADISEAIMAQL
jgi:transcriptional/translational regulatory protein YebC/TACO1